MPLPAGTVQAVREWPQEQACAVQDVHSAQGITVISVATPVTTDRIDARALVRNALRQTLGAFLGQPAASIALVSQPGRAIAVDAAPVRLGVSVSHAPGLSLAALARGAHIGVDVMRRQDGVEAHADWLRVARDYLGPQAAARLQATSTAACPVAFVLAWTQLEAGLKCLGLALTEWSPQLGAQLATCQVWTLDFAHSPAGALATSGHFLGSVAVRTHAMGDFRPLYR